MSGVFNRVLVPVEFEPANEDGITSGQAVQLGENDWVTVGEWTLVALELASRLASGGALYLVHATPEFTNYATWMPPARIHELDRGASQHSTRALEAIATRHCTGVALHYVVRPGHPLDIILAASKEYATDAIVLAASARRRISRAFLGSTADKVIRQAVCPVVVVPAGAA